MKLQVDWVSLFTDRLNDYRWHFHMYAVKPIFNSLGSKSTKPERKLCQVL
jgi:hypothetical protein